MESMHEGGDPGRHDDGQTPELRTLLALAGTLRAEFGVAIDAHPGGVGSEAGAVNRAFRSAATVVLGGASPGVDRSAELTWALRRTALRRLEELGVSGPQAEALLDLEPALSDRWLAYLALAPAPVIDDLMKDGR